MKQNKKKYDLIFSVRCNCITSFHLRRNGLQYAAYPFDWLSYVNVLKFCNLYKIGFKSFFVKDDLEIYEEKPMFIVKNKMDILFVHEFSGLNDLQLNFENVADKLKRRLKRLCERITKCKRILMVYTLLPDEEDISADTIVAFEDFSQQFPKKMIDLLLIKNVKNHKGCQIESMANHISKAIIGYNAKVENEWTLNHEAYSELFSHYELRLTWRQKLTNYKMRRGRYEQSFKFAVLKLVISCIPFNTLRGNLREKFHLKRRERIKGTVLYD